MSGIAAVPLLAAAPSPKPKASSSPAPKTQKISEAARGLAQHMRSFDPGLSDKDLETIAKGIDQNLKLGDRVNPHGKALHNWDEPATTFEAATDSTGSA